MRIKSSKIYFEDGIKEGILEIRDGKFYQFVTEGEYDVDIEDKMILPGIIDIHLHGGGGFIANYLGNTKSLDEIKKLSCFFASKGITGYLATVSLWSTEKMCECMSGIADYINYSNTQGSKILGIHLEAPCFNHEKSGAGFMTPEWMPNPSVSLAKRFVSAGKGHLKYVALAPELNGAEETIRYYKQENIQVSAAHTNANSEEMKKGIKWGISSVCHAGNAISMIHQRDIGVLGNLLLNKEIKAELICDFIHLHPEFIDLVIQNKGFDEICMIADSSELAGLPIGIYDTNPRPVELKENGSVYVYNSDVLCGSSLFVIDGIKNLVFKSKYALEDVIKMSSLNAAKLLDIDDQKGSILIGKDADFIVVDSNLRIYQTYVEGKIQYDIDLSEIKMNESIIKLKRASIK